MSARLLSIFLALAACGPREIIVVELPPGSDGGRPEQGPGCADDTDCAQLPTSFCEKPSCGARLGHCNRKPPVASCSAVLEPVCGCNGVNYWNDCHRVARGIESRVPGACAAPVTCTASAACAGFGASCALLLESASSCAAVPSGVCWVLPLTCPPGDSAWESCSGAPICEGFCAAIRSGATRRQVNSCP